MLVVDDKAGNRDMLRRALAEKPLPSPGTDLSAELCVAKARRSAAALSRLDLGRNLRAGLGPGFFSNLLEKECWQVREAEQGGMGPIEKGGFGREPLPAQLREQVAAAGPKAS